MKSYIRQMIQKPLRAQSSKRNKSSGKFLNSDSYSEKLLWAQSLTQKIFHSSDTSCTFIQLISLFNLTTDPIKNSKVELNWVFGHQTESNGQKMIFYLSPSSSGILEEALVYYISKIVVIYQMKTHEQKHYLAHEKEVSSITGSKKGLCATGEVADFPSIHIWDIESQKTVSVLRGIHRGSIFLLSFICNDQYLVSTGERLSTPVIVHRLNDNSIVLTSFFPDPILCLTKCQSLLGAVPMGNQPKVLGTRRLINSNVAEYESVFIFSSAFEIHLYEVNALGSLNASTADLREQKDLEVSPITCLVAIWINLQEPELHAYSKKADRGIRILTGHLNGQVLIWIAQPAPQSAKKDQRGFTNFKITFEKSITKTPYKHPIIKLLQQEKNTIVVSDDGFLHYWDAPLKENFKNVDLSSLPNREFRSLKLTDIIVANSKLILTTIEGDVLEIAMEMKKEWSKNTFAYVIKEKKLRTFIRLGGRMNCMSLVERDNGTGFLYVAGENARVFGFSKETHEVIDSWSMEEPLTAMDAVSFPDGGIAFAFGTQKGRLQLRIDWEEIPRHYNINHRINDIKFTGDATYLAAAAENKFIYIFNYSSDSYFKNPCKKVEFEKEIPVTLNFLDDFRTLVAGTNIGSHFTLDVPDLKNMSQLVENDKLDVSTFQGRFPQDIKGSKQKVFLPFVMGQQVKFIVGGDENGNLLFWKDKEELVNNSGILFPGHSSPIVAIVVSKSQEYFYTLGLNDNLLLEWKVSIDAVLSENLKLMLDPMEAEKVHDATTYDDVILRELNFSIISFDMKHKVTDSACVFRGTNSPVINTLIQGTYPELDENNFVQKRAPQLVIELEQVFGFHSFASRKTLGYVHYFLQGKTNSKGVKIMQSTNGGADNQRATAAILASKAIQKMLNQARLNTEDSDSIEGYLARHSNCNRAMVYFVSRIVIIYDPSRNKQRFYQSHQAKITCIATHPSKSIVASAECSLSGSIIHVWSIYTLEAIRTLKASHSNGVLIMNFSKDGCYLVTIATDKVFSIEVWDWHNEISKVFRNTGLPPILDVQFNPHNPMQIATGGYNHVALWEIKGTSLLRAELVNLNEEDKAYLPFVTALSFGSYLLGGQVVTDIIVGTNYGDIGVVSAGSFCTVKKKAHSKMVNIVQVADIYHDKTVVVTAGEDEMIRLWSFGFTLLSEFSIRHCDLFPPKISANLSAQSIDFFLCQCPTPIPWAGGEDRISNPIMLVGTRNGDIFEVKFNRQATSSTKVRFSKKKQEDELVSPGLSPSHLKENVASSHAFNLELVQSRVGSSQDHSLLQHPHRVQESGSVSNVSSVIPSDSELPQNQGMRPRLQQNHSAIPGLSHSRMEEDRSGSFDFQGTSRIRDYEEPSSPMRSGSPIIRNTQKIQEEHERDEEDENGENGSDEDLIHFEGEKNERISFASQAVLRNHCIQHPTTPSNIYSFFSQKKVHVALHPKHNIAVTVGDQNAIVWNLDTHQDLTQKHLDGIATCAVFSPDGNILAVGFTTSTVTLYESKIDVSTFGKLPDRYKTSPFELKAILKCKDSKMFPVISMEFSPSGNMFAVSFDNNKAQAQEDEASFGRANSFVTVYMSTTSKKNYGKHHLTDSKQSYIKYTEIKCPSLYEAPRSKNQMGMAVHFMTFSMDEDYLMLYYQLVDSFQTRDNKNLSDCSYVIWDLHTDNQVNNLETLKSVSFKMNQFHFPNHINGEYNQLTLLKKEKKTQRSVQISSVETLADLNTLILGNIYGDLHILRSSFLTAPMALSTDKLSLKNFVQSKTYSAHASFVSQILLSYKKDYLVTTGIYDEAFFKWRLKKEEKMWDIDHLTFAVDAEDVFKETEGAQEFSKLKEELLPSRIGIISDRQQVPKKGPADQPPRVYLSIEKILNRKAFSRRNNLFMSCDNRLVYSVGSQVVLLDPLSTLKPGSPIKQEFISPESYSDSTTFPDVSCLQMAPNQMFLAVGTTQIGAKVIIWELASRTFLTETVLFDCVSIQSIAYAPDSRHLVAIGLHKNYYQMVYYIDSANSDVKSAYSLTFSYPFKIKYVEFVPNSINSFVTCGIQHIARWTYAGSYLSFKSFPIENPKFNNNGEFNQDMENSNRRILKGEGGRYRSHGLELDEEIGEEEFEEEDDEENIGAKILKVSFLGVVFIQETMLTVGDDGMIYIWRDGKITKKQKGHSNNPIFAVARSRKYPLRFATGGMDGQVVVWDLKHSVATDFFSLETIVVYPMSPEAGKESICIKPEFHVQSLVYRICEEGEEEDRIYVGTKTGDIHLITLTGLANEAKLVQKAPEAKGIQLIFADDTQVIKEVGISVDNSRIYSLSETGLFSIFDFASLRKIFSVNFNKPALNLVVSKLILRVILVFEADVYVFSVDEFDKEGIHQLPAFCLQTQTPISYMDVSSDESVMGIAMTHSPEASARIDIYHISHELQQFKLLSTIPNINSSIEFLDFSSNNAYLLFRDSTGTPMYYDLANQSQTEAVNLESSIEWGSEGLKVNGKTAVLEDIYKEGNKVIKIKKISNRNIVVTDDSGTVTTAFFCLIWVSGSS